MLLGLTEVTIQHPTDRIISGPYRGGDQVKDIRLGFKPVLLM